MQLSNIFLELIILQVTCQVLGKLQCNGFTSKVYATAFAYLGGNLSTRTIQNYFHL